MSLFSKALLPGIKEAKIGLYLPLPGVGGEFITMLLFKVPVNVQITSNKPKSEKILRISIFISGDYHILTSA